MSAPPYTVEPVRNEGDLERLLRLGTATFDPEADQESRANAWRDWIKGEPSYRPELVRAVYRGTELAGGCLIYDWELRISGATLRTACIGGVVTWPEYRKRGVASALMQDCTAFAVGGGYPLLLLHGIPGFYHRFGYVDVFDAGVICVKRSQAAALPDSGLVLRTAGVEDAASLLELYHRDNYAFAGSFVRDAARQRNLLATRFRDDPLLLAVDPRGEVRGYAHLLNRSRWLHYAREVVAPEWPAAAALLRAHAARLEGLPEPPEELEWQAPEDSPTAYVISDHLPVRWSVPRAPNDGWMARVGDVGRLSRRLAPLWDARWRSHRPPWSGLLEVSVDGSVVRFAASGAGLAPAPDGACDVRIELPGSALCQLLFGFRLADRIAAQLSLDERATSILETLFPPIRLFIFGSDGF